MKAHFHGLLLTVCCAAAAPLAGQSPVPSPLLGAWAVDVSRLPVPAEARPRSVTMTFSDAGGGKWTTKVDIVAADGSESHGVATYERNGAPAPVQNSPEADMAAVSTPRPDVLVMALSKGGVPGSIRVMTVAPDGKTLTETAVYFDREGRPAMRPAYMTRIR